MYKANELVLNQLLSKVLERGASDLHLIPGEPPVLRIDGALVKLDEYEVLNAETVLNIVDLLMSKEQREVFAQRQDIDLAYSFKDNARFRINVFHQKGLVAAAFRLIPNKIKTVDELGLPAALLDFTKKKQGLVLVVGPTGHGKSTTLAAMIDHINKTRSEHILTIEDPVEFMFQPDKSVINQREVYVDTPSFAQSLKASLREDCNVILVGEMRDLESISTVITIAETGHLVFATLHTNDAGQTIDRIIDVFSSAQQPQIKAQLANVLVGIVSMRLLPKIGGGRVPAVEILLTNNAVKNVIREGKTFELDNIVATNLEGGMVSMDRSLASLVRQNIVSMEDAQPYVKDNDHFAALLAGGR